jgi:hypothetical protein
MPVCNRHRRNITVFLCNVMTTLVVTLHLMVYMDHCHSTGNWLVAFQVAKLTFYTRPFFLAYFPSEKRNVRFEIKCYLCDPRLPISTSEEGNWVSLNLV